MTLHPEVRSALLAGIALLALVSCSDSPDHGTAAAVVEQDAFTIVADDRGYSAPDSIPAGLRHVVFTNSGREIHEAMLVRLPDGMDTKSYLAAVQSGALFPEGAQDYNGPGLLSPGETTEQWLLLDPGQYIIICWNSDHARTRDVHAFTVTEAGRRDDPPPQEDVALNMQDFRFQLSAPLRSGLQVLKLVNAGPSMHELDIYRLHEGKTVQDLLAWRRDDGVGAPPADALGGALDSHDIRRELWIRRNFPPGRYVLQCEMPMTASAQGGTLYATHTEAGMVLAFEIGQ